MTCEVCGCSEARPCLVEEADGAQGPCYGGAPGVCSSCDEEARERALLVHEPFGGDDPLDLDGPSSTPVEYRQRPFPRRVA